MIAAVPWLALRPLFGAAAPEALAPALSAADRMESMPIVTVNLWFDRPVMDEPFVGLPGRRMQWVFDKRIAFGNGRRTCRSCRAARRRSRRSRTKS